MNNRVVRNGTPLADRFDNIAKAARRAGYDPTLFGYTDVSLDPTNRAPDDPDLTTYEGVLPGFKTVMVAPFSTVNTNTGNYSGSQFYLGYMDDYGALRMTTLNCSGQCHLQAVEAKK